MRDIALGIGAAGMIAGPTPKEDATTEAVTERTLVTEAEEASSETEEPETTQSTTTEKPTITETVTERTEAEKYWLILRLFRTTAAHLTRS